MSDARHNPWPHRLALITLATALLPVTMGALTTTLDAGMAFNDWPTSDGHNMLTYPWFRSFGDKFVEHGHRLAGMLVGFVSIILVIVVLRVETRRLTRYTAVGVLVGVILQGLLGGGRVRLDARTLAMIHGQFAALVFGLMALLAAQTSRHWDNTPATRDRERVNSLVPFVSLTLGAVMIQYFLGGRLRHFHTSMDEHFYFAWGAAAAALVTGFVMVRSETAWLRSSGWMLIGLILAQVGLGLGAWITRFGLPSLGFVATARSLEQTWFRTTHTVVGMLLFATTLTAVVRTLRVRHLLRNTSSVGQTQGATPLLAKGGSV